MENVRFHSGETKGDEEASPLDEEFIEAIVAGNAPREAMVEKAAA